MPWLIWLLHTSRKRTEQHIRIPGKNNVHYTHKRMQRVPLSFFMQMMSVRGGGLESVHSGDSSLASALFWGDVTFMAPRAVKICPQVTERQLPWEKESRFSISHSVVLTMSRKRYLVHRRWGDSGGNHKSYQVAHVVVLMKICNAVARSQTQPSLLMENKCPHSDKKKVLQMQILIMCRKGPTGAKECWRENQSVTIKHNVVVGYKHKGQIKECLYR